ncbi:hypothetical protein ACERII_08365 [Evansella sp. AB-rgal1]|uniref:hypothetical protein n=1 Tax=Evansella sp. AB-rgal1 TaxID=3242696 RepID=UPI00359DC8CA
MKKSDFLDQLRLEVGMVYDHAKNKEDFFLKVLYTIYQKLDDNFVITVYSPLNSEFKRNYVLGKRRKEAEDWLGFISLCEMRYSVLLKKNKNQVIFAPVHYIGTLEYIISICAYDNQYNFTQQDIDFVDELTRFIEVKRASYCNKNDNSF